MSSTLLVTLLGTESIMSLLVARLLMLPTMVVRYYKFFGNILTTENVHNT
jgi:hypothetical protein